MRLGDHQFNRLQVLKAIRHAEPVSRTELAALTGLNGATITAITADLVSRGIVIEEKVKRAGTGRPRINLRLSAGTHYAVGASQMDYGGLFIGIVDLRGETAFAVTVPTQATTRLDDLAGQIAALIEAAISRSGIARERIFHAGIGLPAVIDSKAGIVQHMVTFDPGPCAFAAIIESALGIPASIDNNTSLLAACEHWFGERAASQDFIVVSLDLGLTAAIYRDGRLHRGRHGFEPELGHLKIVPTGGRPCVCGASGCLQAYASISGIVDRICETRGLPSLAPSEMHQTFDALLDQDEADEKIAAILAQAGACLGTAIGNLINLNDPERVVILTPGEPFRRAIAPSFDTALGQAVFPPLQGKARIEFKPFEQDMYARGAVALTLERLYQSRTGAPSIAQNIASTTTTSEEGG